MVRIADRNTRVIHGLFAVIVVTQVRNPVAPVVTGTVVHLKWNLQWVSSLIGSQARLLHRGFQT